LSETGITFAQWRTLVRVRAAIAHLTSEVPVTTVAHLVGYQSASAFVHSFRTVMGVTPGNYVAANTGGDVPVG
ncbi:MAG: helix-turn-helix domain-containing protein, partial [Agromyces sp.]